MKRAASNSWPGHSTQAERKAARQHIALEDVGITESTLSRYYTAVHRLCPVLGLDELVSEWIQSEFEDGSPLYLIGDALSGLHHFEPLTKRKLQKSWRLYGIWRKFEVPFKRFQSPRISLWRWLAGVWTMVSSLCSLLLLGFHCLLRTGEILAIRPCDFIIDENGGLLSIPSSKAGSAITVASQSPFVILVL